MGILSVFTKIFKKKEPAMDLRAEPLPEEIPSSFGMNEEATSMENVKAKMDLIATHLDTLRTQYEVLNEKITVMEKMVREMYAMAKS